jgi:hypothetical protein
MQPPGGPPAGEAIPPLVAARTYARSYLRKAMQCSHALLFSYSSASTHSMYFTWYAETAAKRRS